MGVWFGTNKFRITSETYFFFVSGRENRKKQKVLWGATCIHIQFHRQNITEFMKKIASINPGISIIVPAASRLETGFMKPIKLLSPFSSVIMVVTFFIHLISHNHNHRHSHLSWWSSCQGVGNFLCTSSFEIEWN